MNYGLPYMGSKRKLADGLLSSIPSATHFYDLFMGGGAVSHCALLSGKWSQVHINDLDPLMPQVFMDSIKGRYADDYRWIDADMFFRERLADGYVKVGWSFGTNGKDYIYGRLIAPWQHALHCLMFFNDNSLFLDMGIPVPKVDGDTPLERGDSWRAAITTEFADAYIRWLETVLLKGEPADEREKALAPIRTKRLGNFARLDTLTRWSRINAMQSLKPELHRLHATALDYRDVETLPDSVIYCDIPYKDTREYNRGGFDYDAFYDWAARQSAPVFISSYDLPRDRFDIVEDIKHDCPYGTSTVNTVRERLFVPKHQAGQNPTGHLFSFDEMETIS